MSKPITISELRTFIEAVEFASEQEQGWVPNARQWARIREMIFNLEAEPAMPVRTYEYAQQMVPPMPPVMYEREPMPATLPSVAAFPAGPAALPAIAPRHPPVASPSFTTPRTPDIDTSNGQYTSSFA